MPFFVYAVRPYAQLEQLGAHVRFTDASAQAKALRSAAGTGSATAYRVMFAEDALAAEDLLLQVRDAGPAGDD
jgi:hypothetical protein